LSGGRAPLERTFLLDARRLAAGEGGAGRATELLLRGLQELQPPGRWLLWGPAAAADYAWDGATWVSAHGDPRFLAGQRDLAHVPDCDVAIYLHQIRPLRPRRSVTLIHDTIPLRYGGNALSRRAKRSMFRAAARASKRIVTVSAFSKRCIARDLGVPPGRIRVVRYPVDDAMAARVISRREQLPLRNVALYVGRFAPHKNLRRLVDAFGRTSFRNNGGRLLLIGGTPEELGATANDDLIEFRRSCSQRELEELYATSRLLVMPSLEEGFGLPAWEAAACALPVCVSDGGALPEIYGAVTEPFPATSVPAMAEALDRAARNERGCDATRLDAPTFTEFANVFVEEAETALGAG
jgi:glycosyltransferase involved in cell wall biosynthesis